jgi:hypothetical protein
VGLGLQDGEVELLALVRIDEMSTKLQQEVRSPGTRAGFLRIAGDRVTDCRL